MEFHNPKIQLSPKGVTHHLTQRWRTRRGGAVLTPYRFYTVVARALAFTALCGQHRNGLVSPASWALTNRAHKTISTTLLHTRNRIAAEETSEHCAHAFIGWVTLSQEPAREGRGLSALSGTSPVPNHFDWCRRPDECVTGMGGLGWWAEKSRV